MPTTPAMIAQRTQSRRCQHGTAGFTLVELLIALVLISVITVLMFSGLRLGSRAWEGVEGVSERVNDLRVARNFIEQTLRQALPTNVIFDGEQLAIFAGDAEGLEFAAPLSEHVGIPGLYILRLVLEQAGEHDRLVLVRWLLHPDVLEGGDDFPPWEPLLDGGATLTDASPLDRDIAAGAYGRTVLLPQVERFELAYFGVPEGENEPEWLEDWSYNRRLPQNVRIGLDTPAEAWPDAVISLPDGAGVQFDQLIGTQLNLDQPTSDDVRGRTAPGPSPGQAAEPRDAP